MISQLAVSSAVFTFQTRIILWGLQSCDASNGMLYQACFRITRATCNHKSPPKGVNWSEGCIISLRTNASNSSSYYSSASGSAKSTDHSSTPVCRFPLAPEDSQLLHAPLGGNEEASLQGAGYDTGHSSQTSVSHVPMFVPKDDLVLGGAKPSAQDTVGKLQRSSDTVECAA